MTSVWHGLQTLTWLFLVAESSDEEGTILLPTDLDSVDPSVLSNLPASAQLDIITKMRERRVQANRDAFQQRRAKPQSFSSFQLEGYLKASNIRSASDRAFSSLHGDKSGLQIQSCFGCTNLAAVV